ncbi:patatin-like phospholipase family protein [Lachnoclostridium phytofermentans]|uniref:Patatin n=1 Tax=Lachnoclostridium phytofermentans (strain ATCC 700394 / DSM 18823 / ISDg) TaxID=357809 RepID=A9KJD6_LACP7|nr:patatin-like phospholipase family protein [Lachnoclostridium phytofermentans]ABX42548.1 Patatin [Lachnoclostridium phytofermentans ISDg]
MKEPRIGLVLAGGGAKGAYEAGVFKTLWELNLIDNIKVISGTSIGSVNALLFAMNDFKVVKNSWSNLSYSRFLLNEEKFRKEYVPILIKRARHGYEENPIVHDLDTRDIGLISQKGVEDFLKEYVDVEIIKRSKRDLFACAYNIDKGKPEYFLLNELKEEELIDVVLASCAIPYLFPPRNIRGCRYADGGIHAIEYPNNNIDNVPIHPLQDYQLDFAFVVHLSDKKKEEGVEFEKLKQVKMIHIYPSKPLERIGGTGTILLEQKRLEENVELGYRDSMVAIAPKILAYWKKYN